ncbi:hypothetical protein [Peribacillus frigoritolerans]|uniref:hypothetical protein n=1 Tax=Peribacillus frigoritolerans TaxID=450367 RepID=UPI002E1D40CB|nr:hypothetical protein [Peribacillus frigoritolerans]MED3846137.1 hypothetical protein [Peribacillus frigoritolerans]
MSKWFMSILVAFMIMSTSSVFAEDQQKFGPSDLISNDTVEGENSGDDYTFSVDLSEIKLAEGEVASIPLVLVPTNLDNNLIQPTLAFPGPGGILNLWAEGSKVRYKITMSIPATSFTGTMLITNLTSGLSSGRTSVSGFSGSVSYRALYNNRYSAQLTGSATFLGKVVSYTVPNYITWVSK